MITDEKFNQAIWWVLQEINKESVAKHENNIRFEYRASDNNFVPIKEDQRRAIEYLEKENAIKIEGNRYYPGVIDDLIAKASINNGKKPIGHSLEILQPKFDEFYKKFGRNAEKNIQQDNKFIDNAEKEYQISVKDREIWINNYLIGKPHAVGNNFEFFEYVRLQPAHTQIEWKKIPDTIGTFKMKNNIKTRRFVKILGAMGFTGEIKKAFFYKVGGSSLFYRGDKINKQDIEKAGVKIPLFLKQLELAHIKNCPG